MKIIFDIFDIFDILPTPLQTSRRQFTVRIAKSK